MRSNEQDTLPPPGVVGSAITGAVVSIYREYIGRGPTQAKTTISGDHVAVVLQDTLLKAERTLAATGDRDAIRHIRRRFQDTMGDKLIAAVERETGREVIAFMSDHQVEPDYAVEFFVLAPPE